MAARLNLRQRNLQASGLAKTRHTPDLSLLSGLFDPGMLYTGFPTGSTQNAPLRRGATQSLLGGTIPGLAGFDTLFDQAGRVSDPSGLLRALNAGNVLSVRPQTFEAFQRRYGSPGSGSIEEAYRRATARPDLLNWIRSLGLDKGAGSAHFDPGNIRYGNYAIAPGINLQTATRDQLEKWAQSQYGVDLLTLAASPTALLEARQRYMGNPALIFNPEDPGMLRINAIPGLDPETSAARMAAYSQGVLGAQDEASRAREARLGGQLTELLRLNPEAMRTAFGRQLGLTGDYAGAASRAASGAAPQPYDYATQFQAALMPDIIQRAITAALSGF